MAPDAKAWTVEDLAEMPEDGQRYEIIDGALFVTPSPALRHQDAIARLLILIAPYPEAHRAGHVIIAPADVTFSSRRSVQPDLFVVPLRNGRRPRELAELRELLLVVEVLSVFTAGADRLAKRALYRDEIVPEYWLIDLDARAIERSTPMDERVDVLTESIEWRPAGASAPDHQPRAVLRRSARRLIMPAGVTTDVCRLDVSSA